MARPNLRIESVYLMPKHPRLPSAPEFYHGLALPWVAILALATLCLVLAWR